MTDEKRLAFISKYYGVGAIIYLILAVVAIKVMTPATFQIVTSYFTNNALLSQTSTVFVPANHLLWSIQYRWMLVLLMGTSILVPAYHIYKISNNDKNINIHKFRFIDWLITSSIMLVIVLSLAGVQDLMTIFISVVIAAIAYYLIWMAINNYGTKRTYTNNIFKTGVLAILSPWILILIYNISTWIYGGVRTPWFSYGLFIVGLINSGIVIYGYSWHRAQSLRKAVIGDDIYPILLNQVVKVLFALILIIGLKR